MDFKKGLLMATVLMVMVGCGGTKQDIVTLPGGTYNGTVSVPDSPSFGAGFTSAAVATVDGAGALSVITAQPATNLVLGGNGAGSWERPGVVLTVQGDTQVNGAGFSLKFYDTSTLLGTGSFESFPLPSLGADTLAPTTGSYAGDYYLVSSGQFVGLGTATGSIDADGKLRLTASGGSGYANGGTFSGTVQSGGGLSDSVFVIQGSVIGQDDAAYSHDGTTLTVRVKHLAVEPMELYFIVRRTAE